MTDENSRPEKLQQTLTCEFEGVSEEWDIGGMDCAGELRDAIATVREDHDHETVVRREPFWFLEVKWNDKRDEIEIGAFGMHSSYSVADGGER